MALELLCKNGDNAACQKKICDACDCLCSASSSVCPACAGEELTTIDCAYKNGDIIAAVDSGAGWSAAEKRSVVTLDNTEVAALITALGVADAAALKALLVTIVAPCKRKYYVDHAILNYDDSYVAIAATDVKAK